ncbi:MAG: hypothetical protein R2728_06595 [Chitinophagales bacterium]
MHSDLDVTVTDGSLCVEIINDVDGFQPDQICVVHCNAAGLCDTTIIIVTPEPPVPPTDTIYVPIDPRDSTEICLDDVITLPGDVTTITDCDGNDITDILGSLDSCEVSVQVGPLGTSPGDTLCRSL